jgi:hypothetical protein
MSSLRGRHVLVAAVVAALAVAAGLAVWYHRHRSPFETSTYRPELGEVHVSTDGRTLKVQYVGGGCDYRAMSSAAQSRTSVTVAVTVVERIPRGASSADVGIGRLTTIRLAQPLNERDVVDGDWKNQPPLTVLRSGS